MELYGIWNNKKFLKFWFQYQRNTFTNLRIMEMIIQLWILSDDILTPDFFAKLMSNWNFIRRGSLHVEIRFETALTGTVNCICIW